ncbi:hypothetical protein BC938DRAFT_474176 [Jimgerdemannia flammicorona]|uniref:PB1 domain-containing protein n=1 Tax=Jimgerdemannia flammicorona TaxID=994334 RepID=A0A433Q2W5_9FUNG|nr:hypothetical protein BC938DRAFT_474176 [Jimgerdemannia flammicorona]
MEQPPKYNDTPYAIHIDNPSSTRTSIFQFRCKLSAPDFGSESQPLFGPALEWRFVRAPDTMSFDAFLCHLGRKFGYPIGRILCTDPLNHRLKLVIADQEDWDSLRNRIDRNGGNEFEIHCILDTCAEPGGDKSAFACLVSSLIFLAVMCLLWVRAGRG